MVFATEKKIKSLPQCKQLLSSLQTCSENRRKHQDLLCIVQSTLFTPFTIESYFPLKNALGFIAISFIIFFWAITLIRI